MSTIAYIRLKVDIRLRQLDTKNRSYTTIEVDQAVREKYIAKHTMLPPAHVAETSAFTISAGADTFTPTLSGTTYSDALDVRLQLVSTGRYLIPATSEEMDAFRDGQVSTLLSVPARFNLWEDHAGVLRGRCYPGALAAQVVNMYRSRSHALPFSATDLDTAAVYFNEASCNALAQSVAADLVKALPDDELAKRKLRREIADVWHDEAERLFYQEAARRNDVMSSGRTQRWVN